MDLEERFEKAQKVAEDVAEEVLEDAEVVCVIQLGSSLRKEDFTEISDVDLLAVTEKEVEETWDNRYLECVEVSVFRESREKFLEEIEEGNPFEIIAWKFGEVLGGKDIRRERSPDIEVGEETVESWMHSALFHLQEMIAFPSHGIEFRNHAYHAYREAARSLIVIEEGRIVEGDIEVRNELENIGGDESKDFWRLRNQRDTAPEGEGCIRLSELKDSPRYRTLDVVENAVEEVCSRLGLKLLTLEEAEREMKERNRELCTGIHYDFRTRKILLSGKKEGEMEMFVWDMENREFSKYR